MRRCTDSEDLHKQLNKTMGQVKATDKMMDGDVPYEDILVQVNVARGTLQKAGQVVLESHLDHCAREGIEHGDADKTIMDFAKAVGHLPRVS